jgi:hypothetical protein
VTALPTTHVELSPSKAHRWLVCPGSLRFDVEGPESIYAEEGAHAHAVLEAVLKGQQVLAGDIIGDKPASTERIQQAIEVRDYLQQWHQVHPNWALEKETPVEVGKHAWGLEPGIIQGTADAIMYSSEEAVVLDAKFGFVRVEPKDNPQLYLYAAGVVGELVDLFDEPVRYVTLIIAQPNYEGVMEFREHRIFVQDLWKWLAMKWSAVQKALARDLTLDASDERACRFCPGRANCTARTEHLVKLAQDDWREAHTLDDLLPLVTKVRNICKDLEAEAVRRLREGHIVPGFKLVESRSIRKWGETAKPGVIADELGVETMSVVEMKLLSPAQLEKKFKTYGKEVTAQYAVTPKGRPKLAPESDPRPPVSLEDFTPEDVDATQLDE